jgi:ABC-type nitrate/sulfonate/bicarbonate transport system substrate-binding protein
MMKRLGSVLVGLCTVLLILSGLGSAHAGDPQVVEIGAFTPPSLGAFLPPVITEAKTDLKNGIKIKWTHKPPKAYNMGYFSGEFKVGASGALLNDGIRRTKGHKTVWLFNTFNYFGTVLTNDPAIRSLKDLEGRKLAAAKVTTNYAMYRYFAKKEGVNIEKVDTLSASVPALLTYLTAGRVDAIQLWEPAFTKITKQQPGKYYPIFYHRNLQKYSGMNIAPYLGVDAHEDWIKQNPGVVQKIYNAFKDAEKWIWANPDKAAKIIGEKCKIPVAAIQDLLQNNDRLGLNVVPAAQVEKEVFKVFEMSKWEGYLKILPDRGVIYRGLK